MHLAQFNVGRIRYPLDDPRMKDFIDGIDAVHAIADRMGLIYRIKGDNGKNATQIKVLDDPEVVPNLTVWPDVATLKKFVYNTIHIKFMQRRHEWFIPMEGSQNVFWHVLEGYEPIMLEGEMRYKELLVNGPSDWAFDWMWLENKSGK